jgi:hypothetical protein
MKKKPPRKKAKEAGSRKRISAGEIQRRSLGRLQKALVDAVRELCPGTPEVSGKEIPLQLQAVVVPGKEWRLLAKPSLRSQIAEAVSEATAKERVFLPGRVYCYRCESSRCGHSTSPAPERVFGGYGPTGQPRWPELGQLLMELKHPGVEGLYRRPGRCLAAAFMPAEALKHRQLGIFGKESKTYDILGQTVFGYLTLAPATGGDPQGDRAAFTLQAVEVRDRSRRPRVVLNVIGRLSDGSEAMEAFADSHHLRVLDVIVSARRLVGRLGTLSRARAPRAPGRGDDGLVSSAEAVLRKSARSLERLGRQSERRTRHAEKRHAEKRPTSKALEDAAAVPDANLFTDEREGTVVVLGPRNRVHVFSLEGRHITSVTLKKDEVESRKRRKRWRSLDEKGCRRFRESLRSVLGV